MGMDGVDVNEYNLSVAWDVSSAAYSQNFSVSAQEIYPKDLFFKPDGLKMYIVGSDGADVNEYNLSAAWDISTAVYSQNFSVSAQASDLTSIFFKPDGLKMYITSLGYLKNKVYEYNLSVAWDVSSAVYSQNFSVATQISNAYGLFFKPDGLKMYLLDMWTNDYICGYNLSSAWDVSSAVYSQNFSVQAQDYTPVGTFFKPDGLKMYITGASGMDINEYDLVVISATTNFSELELLTFSFI
jgi:hypothetical protein